MISMGALDMGIAEEEIQPIVDSWRQANPNIVSLWWDIHKCVIKAVRERKPQQYKCLSFIYEKGILFIGLPSGRRLADVKPSVYRNEYDRDEISYMGVDASKKWGPISSYGPKFVENIIQAMSRDILAEAMSRLLAAGYKVVMHVHDEMIIDAPLEVTNQEITDIMGQPIEWASGLPLKGDTYDTPFYKKD